MSSVLSSRDAVQLYFYTLSAKLDVSPTGLSQLPLPTNLQCFIYNSLSPVRHRTVPGYLT